MKQEQVQIDYSPSITSYLTECRNEKGYSIQDVAAHLRVSRDYIEALESNDGSRLPERVYILGFVRSYAKFLRIDPDYCIRRFKEEVLQEEASSPLFFPVPLSSGTSPSKKVLLLSSAGLILILAVGYGIKQWTSTPQSLDNTIAEGSETMISTVHPRALAPSAGNLTSKNENKNIQEVSNEASDGQTMEQTSSGATSTGELSQSPEASLPKDMALNFEFSQPSWVEIKDASGNIIIEKTFQAGESYTLSKTQGHRMRTGNAGGINVKIGESPVRPLGKTGEVLSNLSLDAEALSAYLKQH